MDCELLSGFLGVFCCFLPVASGYKQKGQALWLGPLFTRMLV